jgi:hypothetical protein
MAHDKDSQPPEPPPFKRRITIGRVQWIGMLILGSIVVSAIVGLLGVRAAEMSTSSGPLQVHVTYPETMRYRTALPLQVSVSNSGGSALSNVVVQIDRDYLDSFEDVRLTPNAHEVTPRHYAVVLPSLPAGETRDVVAQLEAQRSGSLPATLKVAAEGGASLDLRWSTRVLP